MTALINPQTLKGVAYFTAVIGPIVWTGFAVRPTFKGVIRYKTNEDLELRKDLLEKYSKGGLDFNRH